jgi:hypothetical protein
MSDPIGKRTDANSASLKNEKDVEQRIKGDGYCVIVRTIAVLPKEADSLSSMKIRRSF